MKFNSARFILTRKCAYNCFYCHNEGAGSDENFDKENILNIEDFKFLADVLINDFGLEKATLTGGDPFLFPGVEDFSRHLTENKIFVKAITRGAPLLPLLESGRLESTDLDHICFSIDTLIPSKFAEITRVNENLLSLGIGALELATEKGFKTKVHTVVQPVDYDKQDILNILDFALKNKVDAVKMYELIDPDTVKEPYLEKVLYELGIIESPDVPTELPVRYNFNYKGLTIVPTRCLCNLAIFEKTCQCAGQSLMFDPQGRVNTCLFWDVHKNPYHIELFKEIKDRNREMIVSKISEYKQNPCPFLLTEDEKNDLEAGIDLGVYH